MTFKHAKFADSVVMRSLEKVAFEKGLVKADEVVKTAAKQVDFRPTPDLFLNLLKLSEGLRSAGLDKHANELEKRAFAYKQAQTMYDTHGEKGEDLIEFAHPKGSHKLEDVDGNEAVFETILDQHLKSVDMVNKKPTGKLASSRDILGAIRVVLGQDTNTLLNQKLTQVNQKVGELAKIISETATPEEKGVTTMGRLRSLASFLRYVGPDSAPITAAKINGAITTLNATRAQLQYVDPKERERDIAEGTRKFTFSMSSYTGWAQVSDGLNQIQGLLQEAAKLLQGDSDLLNKIDGLSRKLKSYRGLLLDQGFTPQDRIEGGKEIGAYEATLANWRQVFEHLDPEDKAIEAPRYMAKINELAQKIEQLHKEIVGA